MVESLKKVSVEASVKDGLLHIQAAKDGLPHQPIPHRCENDKCEIYRIRLNNIIVVNMLFDNSRR